MKILMNALFLLSTIILTPYCIAATIPDIQIYCTAKTPKVSFPLPGQPEIINSPEFEEAYVFKDTTNMNSYQFAYKKIDKTLNPKTYLEGAITGRVRSQNATLMTKKIFVSGGKTIANYSYYYYDGNTKKLSYVKALIYKGLYYSWAVQSYEGSSVYSSDSIFAGYSKYVAADGSYCK